MRITDLYDLENKPEVKNMIKKALINDIESLAQCQFKDDKFQKFMIQIRLKKISRFDCDCSYK